MNRFETSFGVKSGAPWTFYNPVIDTGHGNVVIQNYASSGIEGTAKNDALTFFKPNISGERTHDFTKSTPDTPYISNELLFYWPSEMYWNLSPQPTVTKDTTIISGEYVTIPSPGSGAITAINRRNLYFGYELPISHMLLLARIKATSSPTTITYGVEIGGTLIAGTLGITTSWSTIAIPLNFTARSVGDLAHIYFDAPTVNQAVDVAWIAFVPMEKYLWGFQQSADPPAPSAGQYVIWMSDGTGKGDTGDVLIGSSDSIGVKWGTIFDHSVGNAW